MFLNFSAPVMITDMGRQGGCKTDPGGVCVSGISSLKEIKTFKFFPPRELFNDTDIPQDKGFWTAAVEDIRC